MYDEKLINLIAKLSIFDNVENLELNIENQDCGLFVKELFEKMTWKSLKSLSVGVTDALLNSNVQRLKLRNVVLDDNAHLHSFLRKSSLVELTTDIDRINFQDLATNCGLFVKELFEKMTWKSLKSLSVGVTDPLLNSNVQRLKLRNVVLDDNAHLHSFLRKSSMVELTIDIGRINFQDLATIFEGLTTLFNNLPNTKLHSLQIQTFGISEKFNFSIVEKVFDSQLRNFEFNMALTGASHKQKERVLKYFDNFLSRFTDNIKNSKLENIKLGFSSDQRNASPFRSIYDKISKVEQCGYQISFDILSGFKIHIAANNIVKVGYHKTDPLALNLR
ncbi:hypothetical protein O9G_005346 [Rozella allomycis CSF55]|uniref:RNI-like protein n=1 Tax=Rozella allomycis (strain CSF55) TaxID=988480 RepID=A0A075B2J7_ROZAC|nr:hypothetical protein O9G_005346 [Rozella allomycis CSF55]|eukprot:EPZ36777.1 hypothetical protein O9G_005346 [Rozella allomycis CSF55]